MSKYLNIATGDYTIKVQPGGEIKLDTPPIPASGGFAAQNGRVLITGDLVVEGETTSVSTQNLLVEDNIIELNKVPDGTPVTSTTVISGIEVNLGDNAPNARWVYDGSIIYYDPQNPGNTAPGVWVPRDDNDKVLGIQAVSITTPGTNLNLLGVLANGTGNPGVISVAGTVEYEKRVLDRDHIPNKQYVDDTIFAQLTSAFQRRIEDGSFAGSETYVEARDDTERVGEESRVEVAIKGVVVTDFREDYVDLYDIRVDGNKISSTGSNQDLVLSADGVGRVVVNDNLLLTKTPHGDAVVDPGEPTDGTSLYSKTRGAGGTGVYFVNEDATRDELISKNRAIVYSMLF